MNTNKTQAEQLPQDAVMQSVLKASDLRIGNLITECAYDFEDGKRIRNIKEDEVIKVISVNKDNTIRITDKMKKERGCYKLNNNFEPIKLTKGWFLKLGFKKDSQVDLYRFENELGAIVYYPEDYFTKEKINFMLINTCLMINTINYVDELQNLYFALTGSELTVA